MNHNVTFGSKPSNQLMFPWITDGLDRMEEVRAWVKKHPAEFDRFVSVAKELGSEEYPASPNYCIQKLRHEFHVGIPNQYAAGLARIAIEKHGEAVHFNIRKSKFDPFTEAKL